MNFRNILLALAGMALAVTPTFVTPSWAQRTERERSGRDVPHASAPAGAPRAPEVFRGGPRGPAQWNDFHHDTAPARLAPHRFGTTNFPRPNSWAGDIHGFDLGRWQGGHWLHATHGGRFGWWWVVGPDWYMFDQPVYPYPDLYTPFGEPFGWWYWCDPYREYYPFVTYCPVPWESVMPRD